MKTIIRSALLLILAASFAACNALYGSVNQTETADFYSEQTSEVTVPSQTADPFQSNNGDLIEKTFVDESLSPKYEIQAIWPNLSGGVVHAETFNQEINQLVQSAQDEFLNAVTTQQTQIPEGEESPVSTLAIDYDLTFAEQGLFSVQLTATQYIAISAHPFTISHTFNFDTNQGRFLALSDLFLPGSGYQDGILDILDSVLVERGFDYQPGTAKEVLQSRENWNLMPEGLRINFDEYEVAPYAAGPQYVLLPWDDLAQWLDFDGPAAVFIGP